jgi:hypothetical protein
VGTRSLVVGVGMRGGVAGFGAALGYHMVGT